MGLGDNIMQKQTFVLIVNANKEFKRTEKKGKLRLVVDNTVDEEIVWLATLPDGGPTGGFCRKLQ